MQVVVQDASKVYLRSSCGFDSVKGILRDCRDMSSAGVKLDCGGGHCTYTVDHLTGLTPETYDEYIEISIALLADPANPLWVWRKYNLVKMLCSETISSNAKESYIFAREAYDPPKREWTKCYVQKNKDDITGVTISPLDNSAGLLALSAVGPSLADGSDVEPNNQIEVNFVYGDTVPIWVVGLRESKHIFDAELIVSDGKQKDRIGTTSVWAEWVESSGFLFVPPQPYTQKSVDPPHWDEVVPPAAYTHFIAELRPADLQQQRAWGVPQSVPTFRACNTVFSTKTNNWVDVSRKTRERWYDNTVSITKEDIVPDRNLSACLSTRYAQLLPVMGYVFEEYPSNDVEGNDDLDFNDERNRTGKGETFTYRIN